MHERNRNRTVKLLGATETFLSALMQTGAFAFLATLMFRPQVLTAYASGDILLVTPRMATIITVIAMIITGICCVVLSNHSSRRMIAIYLVLIVAMPSAAFVLAVFVHAIWVPLTVSILLGITSMLSVFLFQRQNQQDSAHQFLSVGIGLIVAISFSHIAYLSTGAHFVGSALVAAMVFVSSITIGIVHANAHFSSLKRNGAESEHAEIGEAFSASATEVDSSQMRKSRLIDAGFEQKHWRRTFLLDLSPLILESFICGISLGSTWGVQSFSAMVDSPLYFIIGALMEVIFIVVLYRIWLRVQNASVLIYGSIPALIVSILLVVFNPLTSDVLSPVSYCFALFTELSFLSLAWAAAMVLDRSHLRPGAITCSFLSLLLLSFLIGTTIFPADYQLASIQLVTIFCVIFFIVLVWYAHTQGVQSVRAEQSASISYDAILLQRCNLLSDRYGLSPRERELLPYFVMGMSSSAIGRRQFISQPTVKTHRYRIFQKFGIRSHEELYDLFVAEG